jgi:ABC-type multidrug transport system fused ATPase/permease subunit
VTEKLGAHLTLFPASCIGGSVDVRGHERRPGDLPAFLRYARPYRRSSRASSLSLLATPLALSCLPWRWSSTCCRGRRGSAFLGPLLPALTASTERVLAFSCGLFVLVRLLSEAQGLSYTLLRAYTGERMVLDLRASLFRHAQRLSLGYHDRKGTADTNYRIQSDAGQIQQLAVDGLIPIVTAGLTLVGMVWVTARIDLLLAGIALGAVPALALVTWAYRRRLRERWRDVKSQESRALSVVQKRSPRFAS